MVKVVTALGRIVLFWAIVTATCVGLHAVFPLPMADFWSTTARALDGDFEAVGTRDYAFALSFGLGAVATGFAAAFLIMHVVVLRLTLFRLRRRVEATGGMGGFAAGYDGLCAALEKNALIGHAWTEFDKALLHHSQDGVICGTARPQGYFNLGVAREKFFGLKMMGALPGYFVGIGLLLTFAGLVLALNKASAAVNSADATAMQGATRDLLQVATFKFSTSIAGLGASIGLSLLFRIYTILLEGGFTGFCEAVETRVRYLSAQQIAAESRDYAARQADDLMAINSVDFPVRMGRALMPGISAAFERALTQAMTPVTASIDTAVNRLADTSQAGMAEMVTRFSRSVHSSAGTELRELATTLKDMQSAMVRVQRGLDGSGADFGRRMAEAAENLNRLVIQAGARLGEGTDQTRAALMEAVAALRETFDHANRKVDESLGAAAGGASARLEEAMGRVLVGLEVQVAGFREMLDGFQDRMAGQLDETRAQASAVQIAATDAVAGASAGAARALQDGLADAMAQIRGEIDRFVTAMKTGEVSLTVQADAVRNAADASRQVAEAFNQTAQDVWNAALPLAETGERIAGATDRLGESAGRSVAMLDLSQQEGRRLAQALTGHVANLDQVWLSYAARFEAIDEALGRAFERLAQGTQEQHERIAGFAREMDANFARALDALTACIGQLRDNSEEMASAVDDLRQVLRPQAAE